MRIAYFDCIAGASGDMILGALVDAGLLMETLRAELAKLPIDEFEIIHRREVKQGFSATKVEVQVTNQPPSRHLTDIERIVMESTLAPVVKERARQIFRRIARVEAAIHGVALEQVHLHELGGVDTIIDVVGTLVGLDALGIEHVFVSPLPLGRGWVQGAHGKIPLPAPATLGLLIDAPVVGSPLEAELVTPTAAALFSTLATSFGPIPAMRLQRVGYGAGTLELPIPNILRVLIGSAPDELHAATETLVMLETNIDDMNPEFYEHVMERLLDAGALDVFLTPVQMKKGRPASVISVLCHPNDVNRLTQILFAESTTLGVRQYEVKRHCLPRSIEAVETPYGIVRVKVTRWDETRTRVKPEYEDCRRLAEQHNIPLREVYRAAEMAAQHLVR
ncbi:MAG: nickel pincer cofactor biosynthesis protein LarC [Anaerolineae bacterium]|nr:nickel pincer cofactor biosynthesis protein LarC [Anaerolineae bacterium]MDW8070147.1 nickel pincer cofactor biosynthesis protein LarC [Anaerolineae bacterium]